MFFNPLEHVLCLHCGRPVEKEHEKIESLCEECMNKIDERLKNFKFSLEIPSWY